MKYDPDHDVDPSQWLSADEATRMAAVTASHQVLPPGHPPVSQPRVHAALHVMIETQLADGKPPEVLETFERLTRAGLNRHQALHALGSAATEVVFGALQGRPYDAARYVERLHALKAEDWKPV